MYAAHSQPRTGSYADYIPETPSILACKDLYMSVLVWLTLHATCLVHACYLSSTCMLPVHMLASTCMLPQSLVVHVVADTCLSNLTDSEHEDRQAPVKLFLSFATSFARSRPCLCPVVAWSPDGPAKHATAPRVACRPADSRSNVPSKV